MSWFQNYAVMTLPLKLVPNATYTMWVIEDAETRQMPVENLSLAEYSQLPESIKDSLTREMNEYDSLHHLISGEQHVDCHYCGTITVKSKLMPGKKPYETLNQRKLRLEREKEATRRVYPYLVDPTGAEPSVKVKMSDRWTTDRQTWIEISDEKNKTEDGKERANEGLRKEKERERIETEEASRIHKKPKGISADEPSTLRSKIGKCKTRNFKSRLSSSSDGSDKLSSPPPPGSFAVNNGEFTFESAEKPVFDRTHGLVDFKFDTSKPVFEIKRAVDAANGRKEEGEAAETLSASLAEQTEYCCKADQPLEGNNLGPETNGSSGDIISEEPEGHQVCTSSEDSDGEKPFDLEISAVEEVKDESLFYNDWSFWRILPEPIEESEETPDSGVDAFDYIKCGEINMSLKCSSTSPEDISALNLSYQNDHDAFLNYWYHPPEPLEPEDLEAVDDGELPQDVASASTFHSASPMLPTLNGSSQWHTCDRNDAKERKFINTEMNTRSRRAPSLVR